MMLTIKCRFCDTISEFNGNEGDWVPCQSCDGLNQLVADHSKEAIENEQVGQAILDLMTKPKQVPSDPNDMTDPRNNPLIPR